MYFDRLLGGCKYEEKGDPRQEHAGMTMHNGTCGEMTLYNGTCGEMTLYNGTCGDDK
jgi:hypothetical protein